MIKSVCLLLALVYVAESRVPPFNPLLSDAAWEETCTNYCQKDNKNHACVVSCEKYPNGKVACVCPKNYIGDGRDRGTGCTFHNENHGSNTGTILLVAGAGVLCIILALGLFMAKRWREKQNIIKHQLKGKVGKTLKHFSLKELSTATEGFKQTNEIGSGGQGTVFRGEIQGDPVAVKRCCNVTEKGIKDCINEIELLSKLEKKPHIAKVIGYHASNDIICIVTRLMINGSVYGLLHEGYNPVGSSWPKRLEIALGAATGLHFLHQMRPPIIHRDIKTRNLLLDDTFETYLSDFGISRAVSEDQTHVLTRVEGTSGYIPPEVREGGIAKYDVKSDIYSFGVVLLELVTSLKAYRPQGHDEFQYLYGLIHERDDSELEELIDHKLEEADSEQMHEVLILAKACCSTDPAARPDTTFILMELARIERKYKARA